MLDRALKRLAKKSRRGFRGYPMATIAVYGPDERRATKLVASVFRWEDDTDGELHRWFSETTDVRADPKVAAEVLAFFEQHGVLSVGMAEGEYCPMCPFWIGRDRWTGKLVSPPPALAITAALTPPAPPPSR